MSGIRNVETQIAMLQELRDATPEIQIKELRTALGNRNNYVVSKAADLVRELHLTVLAPELTTAYERFFRDPVKTDPQCWAKNALSHCLAELELGSHELFLRGLCFHQLEPVWGGQSDTAVTLRSNCALALSARVELSDEKVLGLLIDALSENRGVADAPVRIAIFRAMERISSPAAALLLRLRVVLGGDTPEVMGVCFSGVLSIEGLSSIDFVAGFLAPDEAGAEAALAISATRSLQGYEKLKECFAKTSDRWFCGVLLTAIALTRQEKAMEYLLELIREESFHAEAAVKAMVGAAPTEEWMAKLEDAVSDAPRLFRALKDCCRS